LFRPDAVQSRGVATAADNDPVLKDVEHRLKCTCGCNLDIFTCRTTDFTCTYSPALHQELLALQAEGKTPEQLIAAFVSKYGEQVLMAPKPEGFNLAGYLVPGAAVLTAGTVLVLLIGRRSRRGAGLPVPASAAGTPPVNPADAERLRLALRDVED
jgi:cytochrome c-type biogenesis protein CcmH